MTDGLFISAAAVFAILAAVAVLAGLSSLILWVDNIPERHAVAIFWGCLAWTWLLAVSVAVGIQGSPW